MLVWTGNLLLCDFTPPLFCNGHPFSLAFDALSFLLDLCVPCSALVVQPRWVIYRTVRGGVAPKVCIFSFKFVAVIALLLVLLVLLVFYSLRDTPLAGIFIVLPFPKHSRLLGLFSRINIFLRLPFPLKLNNYLKSPSSPRPEWQGCC